MKFHWNKNIKIKNKKYIEDSIRELNLEIDLKSNVHCLDHNNKSVIFYVSKNLNVYIIRIVEKLIRDGCYSIFEKIDNDFIGETGFTFYGSIIEKENSDKIKFSHICWGIVRTKDNKWEFWNKLLEDGYKNEEYLKKMNKLLELLNENENRYMNMDTKDIYDIL